MRMIFSHESRQILSEWAKHFASIEQKSGFHDVSTFLEQASEGQACDQLVIRSIVDIAQEPAHTEPGTDSDRKRIISEIYQFERLYAKTEQSKILLEDNLQARKVPDIPNSEDYPTNHKLTLDSGWEPPSPELVKAYFQHFKEHTEYDSDQKIASLLGVSNSRRIREWATGEKRVPYDIWRRFLVMTGRDVCDIVKTIYIAI